MRSSTPGVGRTGKLFVIPGPPVPENGSAEAYGAEAVPQNEGTHCRKCTKLFRGDEVRTGSMQAAHGHAQTRQTQMLESVPNGAEEFSGIFHGDAFAHISQIQHDDTFVRGGVFSSARGSGLPALPALPENPPDSGRTGALRRRHGAGGADLSVPAPLPDEPEKDVFLRSARTEPHPLPPRHNGRIRPDARLRPRRDDRPPFSVPA